MSRKAINIIMHIFIYIIRVSVSVREGLKPSLTEARMETRMETRTETRINQIFAIHARFTHKADSNTTQSGKNRYKCPFYIRLDKNCIGQRPWSKSDLALFRPNTLYSLSFAH